MTVKHWFLPDSPDLLGELHEQAATTIDALHALVSWSSGDVTAAAHLVDCERRADETKRRLWRHLRDAFSPPLDAEDLYALSAGLDEVLDAARDLIREMDLLQLTPDAPVHEMAGHISAAVGDLAAAFAQLDGHGDATTGADDAIAALRQVEAAYRAAMSALTDVDDLREVMGRREAYRRLSRMADLVRTVAERVWYAVVKES